MYTHTTLASAASQLALRLSDPASRFYTPADQYAAIRESLRLWNLITSNDRARGVITTASSTAFYDLSATLFDASSPTPLLLRPRTLTDADLVAEINSHLVEDNLPTDMFTTAQIVEALQQSRDQFLADTAIVLTARTDVIAGGSDGTVDFPDTVIGIRRAIYATASGAYVPLQRSDERSATMFNRLWQTPSTPRSYSVTAAPSLRFRLIPPPSESGTLRTLVTASGPAFDTTQTASTLLGVPDDLAWAVKYGALATLFTSDGPGSDTDRAERSSKLYALGVALATKLPTILHAELDGFPVTPAALHRTDRFQGGWEGRAASRPRLLSIAAPDLVALTPPPDASPHSVTLDVVRNTIVPAAPADYLQIGRERLGAILGMAQWICVFKCGGEELRTADEYFTGFFEEAQHYAFQRSAASSALTAANMIGQQNLHELPLEVDPSAGVRNADEVRQERNARRRATTQ